MKPLGPLIATAVIALAAPAAALAGGPNGGAVYGAPPAGTPKTPTGHARKLATSPTLEAFSVAPDVLTPGQTPSLVVRVKGRAPTIRLRVVVSWPQTTNPQRTVELGRIAANSAQTIALPQLADPALPEGQMTIRIAGRDSAGRVLRPGARLSRVAQIQVRAHVFPLQGVFSYGGPEARYGASRNGHIHQGQDLFADEGTPVVAPRSGTISDVGYQAGAAGWYVVLDADGENFDYAFMHLQEGSIPVQKGEHVDQGQRVGSVGHTGDAQGNHLHFEVWDGPWWAGGHTVDPLPYLQQWQQWSAVRAI